MTIKQLEVIKCITDILRYDLDPENELAKLDVDTRILKDIQFSLDAIKDELQNV